MKYKLSETRETEDVKSKITQFRSGLLAFVVILALSLSKAAMIAMIALDPHTPTGRAATGIVAKFQFRGNKGCQPSRRYSSHYLAPRGREKACLGGDSCVLGQMGG